MCTYEGCQMLFAYAHYGVKSHFVYVIRQHLPASLSRYLYQASGHYDMPHLFEPVEESS